jgi:hypothetical protein
VSAQIVPTAFFSPRLPFMSRFHNFKLDIEGAEKRFPVSVIIFGAYPLSFMNDTHITEQFCLVRARQR